MDFLKNLEMATAAAKEHGEQSFIIKSGNGRIMFSAPHCVEQIREGKIKFSEPETGILVEMLHSEFGCPIIRKTSNRNDDANYDPVSDYKDALAEYIKENNIGILVDLHQLAPFREEMINFGTGKLKNIGDKNLINVFLGAFTKNRVGMIQMDEPFDASYEHTVSSTIHRKCSIPCLQIEINSRLVNEKYEESSIEAVYKALSECYLKLKEL